MITCDFCFEQYDPDIACGVCPHCGYYMGMKQSDPRFLPIGCCINHRYVIGGVLGNGGFGITYRAWDKTLQVVVAIKEYYQRGVVNRTPGAKEVLVVAPNRREEFLYGKERLLREARIVSKFQSRPIVRVNDFFEENGTSYMVMEYIDCLTLEGTLLERRKPLETNEVVSIGLQICEALDEIHSADVLHRDIAPDNIFITNNGDIKIIDFGSARLDQEDTMEQLILVKEGFSPIEQYEALNPKQRLQQAWTDIYALGATLYYLVTGVRPEESRSRKTNIDNHAEDIKEPRELNPLVSENLNNTIMKAMAVNSHERFSSAKEMANALQDKILVQPLALTRKRKKLRRALSIAAAFVVALSVALFAILNGATQYDDITLDEANISIWFPCEGSSGFSAIYDENEEEWQFEEGSIGSDQKAASILSIISEEAKSAQFDNITVSVRGIPKGQYNAALTKANADGSMPSLFICLNEKSDYMENAVDVSKIIRSLDTGARDCHFIGDYSDRFSTLRCIPTGFTAPILYLNTAFVTDYTPGRVIDSAASLLSFAGGNLGYMPIAMNDAVLELHRKSLSDFDDRVGSLTKVSREDFLSENAAAFLSDNTDYAAVQEKLIGLFSLAVPGAKPTCSFRDFWAINTTAEAEQTAAEVMLAYFFTDNAQNLLYLRKDAMALPINRSALSRYATVYSDMELLEERANDFVLVDEISEWK